MEVTVPEYKILPEVKLDPRVTALVVVDMQVDFVNPKGKALRPRGEKNHSAIFFI